MNVVMIIPTGIGCEIGGHCGDGNAPARLLGACCGPGNPECRDGIGSWRSARTCHRASIDSVWNAKGEFVEPVK